MADPFESGLRRSSEVDPAADFIAQQQNDIAGLESGIFGGSQEFSSEKSKQNAKDQNVKPSQVYESISKADVQVQKVLKEPEKLRIWRERYTKMLAEKDRESEKKQQAWLAKARKELKEWEKNRREQLDKIKKNNRQAYEILQERAAQAQFMKDRDHHAPGSEWERVSKLCDFNPKVSKGSRDVSRMRSSLLRLKENPRPLSIKSSDKSK